MTYWDKQAKENIPESDVTLRDQNQRELELRFITWWFPVESKPDLVVEAGCGNGYSTRLFSREAKHIYAFDFSEEMIRRAIKVNKNLDNVVFAVDDVRSIKLESEVADIVISQRCLINLMSWEEQKTAITEIHRVLKPGGMFILTEGLKLDKLNDIRKRVGLPKINVVSHNNNFDMGSLVKYIKRDFDIQEVRTFGIYDFITRILHPLLVYPEEPKYDAKINQIAKTMETELVAEGKILSRNCMNELSKFSRIIGIAAIKKVK